MKLTLFRNVHDTSGRVVERPWDAIVPSLQTHHIGEKDGWCVAFATFSGNRGNGTLASRSAIALDVETSKATGEIPPSEEVVARRLRALGCASVLWTTFNHTPNDPRYRVVVPTPDIDLGNDTALLLDDWLSPALAERLALSGVVDSSKFGAASLFFLPRHPVRGSNYRFASATEGPLVDLKALYQEAIDLMVADEAEQRALLRSTVALDDTTRGVIESFNKSHPVEQLLAQYGYQRRGRRWKSPHQSRDSAGGTEIRRDPDGSQRWISFSESDRLAKVGQPTRKSSPIMAFGTSFDLMRHFECRGNFRKALDKATGAQHDRHNGQ